MTYANMHQSNVPHLLYTLLTQTKAKKFRAGFIKKDTTEKKTCIGGNHTMIKTSSMNKNKRRNYKKYRGQGR